MKFFLLMLLPFILFYPTKGYTKVLPELFYDSAANQEKICTLKKDDAEFWFNLMSRHIDKLLTQFELSDFELDVLRNQFVTQSYLELSRLSQGQESSMTYVYANASHHLGRLVRYHFWDRFPNEALGKKDKSYISGEILGTTVRTAPRFLAKTLMAHSLFLYKTLSWSLGASIICGQPYVAQMLKVTNTPRVLKKVFPHLPPYKQKELLNRLRKAFGGATPALFILSFVAFEQAYLQYTMYASPEVRLPSSLGILDKMRYIPFNGERKLSYYDWCKSHRCRKTSLDLELRILFDQTVILEELSLTQHDRLIMEERLEKTDLENVSDFILKNLFPGRMKEDLLTQGIHDRSYTF